MLLGVIKFCIDISGNIAITEVTEEHHEFVKEVYSATSGDDVVEFKDNRPIHAGVYTANYTVKEEWNYEHTECDVFLRLYNVQKR